MYDCIVLYWERLIKNKTIRLIWGSCALYIDLLWRYKFCITHEYKPNIKYNMVMDHINRFINTIIFQCTINMWDHVWRINLPISHLVQILSWKLYTYKTLVRPNFCYLNYKMSQSNLVHQLCQYRTKVGFIT